MENNELMINEEIETMNDEIVVDGGSSLGTAAAMAIGAGLALAIGAGVKLAKRGIAAIKAKRELRQPDKEIIVDAEEIEEIVEPEA